ncbi:MAG: hypothetical protein ACRD2A_04520 [Vicinamibacterales bacterium]
MGRTTIRTTIVAAIFALIGALVAVPLEAKKPTTSPAKGPKTTVGQAKSVKPAKTTTAKGPSTSKGSTMKSAKATSPKGSSKKTSTTTTASSTTSGSTPTTITTETPLYTNDVALKLSTKPNQLAKLETALGLGTLTPEQINGATSGVKNFGQLNAMVNTVMNNPTVEFADLKALMTGLDMKGEPVLGQTTTYSLGQAKQQLGIADTDGDAPTTTTQSSTTTTSTKGKSKKRNNTSGGTQ